ncbi:hypothetical protein NKH77_46060 [Streptomyces sp. M19]
MSTKVSDHVRLRLRGRRHQRPAGRLRQGREQAEVLQARHE